MFKSMSDIGRILSFLLFVCSTVFLITVYSSTSMIFAEVSEQIDKEDAKHAERELARKLRRSSGFDEESEYRRDISGQRRDLNPGFKMGEPTMKLETSSDSGSDFDE